jgi:hypothetical protein
MGSDNNPSQNFIDNEDKESERSSKSSDSDDSGKDDAPSEKLEVLQTKKTISQEKLLLVPNKSYKLEDSDEQVNSKEDGYYFF